MAPSNPSRLTHISLIYRLYFQWFEPFGALAGTYLILTNPTRFIRGTIPLPFAPTVTTSDGSIPISPLLRMQLINVASLYILFFIAGGVILRLTRQKSIWLAVLSAFVCTDVGHLFAVWELAPQRIAEVASWTSDEWVNYGTLFAGLSLRCAFILGIGRRST